MLGICLKNWKCIIGSKYRA